MAENWLKDYGFIALQLPRRDLAPGDVLYRADGAFDTKVGTLPMIFPSAGELTGVAAGEPVADIARSITKTVDVSLGVRILGALFGGGASSRLGADTDLKHARTLSVTYEDVTQDSLAILALQAWLERSPVDTARQAMVWLNEGRLAAVTAVLRTPTLSIAAHRENGSAIGLSVPEIEGVVSAEAKVSGGSGASSTLTFTGQHAIAFGFQAFKLLFDGNVSFGVEQIRGRPTEDVAAIAWTPADAIDELGEGPPLGE